VTSTTVIHTWPIAQEEFPAIRTPARVLADLSGQLPTAGPREQLDEHLKLARFIRREREELPARTSRLQDEQDSSGAPASSPAACEERMVTHRKGSNSP
jgi:hypothetical protein